MTAHRAMATSCWKAALFPTRPVLFRGDSPVLEHRYLVGGALLQIDEKEFGRLALLFFIQLRVALVFFFLVPALALHWMARKR